LLSVALLGFALHDRALPGWLASAQRIETKRAVGGIADFYERRDFRPLWTDARGLSPAAEQLLDVFGKARRDGLDPARYLTPDLAAAVNSARKGDAAILPRVDRLISRAFVAYVRDLHGAAATDEMFFVDREIAPKRPLAPQLLQAAAKAPSLGGYVAEVRRMNPLFEGLRDELERRFASGQDSVAAARLLINLERARLIPADPGRRFIVVDAAGARLWMYEDGRLVDSMRVIVGRPAMATPMMAAFIRFAVLNPYWNVPADLVRDTIAPRVLRSGVSYLAAERLEVLSDFTRTAVPVDPQTVDWAAVASGRQRLKVRQLPGGNNMMGKVKFMFPNRLGIYLHDTPHKWMFGAANRRQSSGCIRVEDADRLGRWLFERPFPVAARVPEQRVELPEPVPVYITYLTAVPGDRGVRFQADVYGRDAEPIAQLAAAS
jgi:murein L,D-transpeptidase YcbB/YkuD